MGAGILPCGAYVSVLKAVFIYLGDEMMALLEEDAVPAFNIYAMFRFHDDVMAICQFADTCAVPDLAVCSIPFPSLRERASMRILPVRGGERRMFTRIFVLCVRRGVYVALSGGL